MIAAYYLAVLVGLVIAGPFLLVFRKKARAGIWQKLGFVPSFIGDDRQNHKATGTGKSAVWFHAVSVGEFNAVYPLLNAFHERHPDLDVVVSTTTATGQALAKQKIGNWAKVIYFPLDLPWSVSAWLDAVRPSLIVVVETEMWPGFLFQCKRRSIPVAIVNGRMSPRSFKGYLRLKPFFSRVLKTVKVIGAQSESEAARYRRLGGPDVNLEILGNLKFDGLRALPEEEQVLLLERLNIVAGSPVIVAGSTHEGEEEAVINAWKDLRAEISQLKLIIAPRHPERFNRVAQLIERHGMKAKLFSKNDSFQSSDDVYVVDAIGHLTSMYSTATVAFVGGSLVSIGGHNLLEPYVYAVPVVCGKYIYKTRDVAQALIDNQAISIINNQGELTVALRQLLGDEAARRERGRRGYVYLSSSQGAVRRALNMLNAVLKENSHGANSIPGKPGHQEPFQRPETTEKNVAEVAR